MRSQPNSPSRHQVGARISEQAAAQLRRRCQREGLSLAEGLRRALLGWCGVAPPRQGGAQDPFDERLLTGRPRRFMVSVPSDLLRRLDRQADAEDLSRSAVVRIAIARLLGHPLLLQREERRLAAVLENEVRRLRIELQGLRRHLQQTGGVPDWLLSELQGLADGLAEAEGQFRSLTAGAATRALLESPTSANRYR